MNRLLQYLQLKSLHRTVIVMLVVLLTTAVFQARAAGPDGAKLVRERRCYPCHDMTKTLIGPPFKAIAARYQQHKDIMVDVLAEKIILGGGGNWGVVPMVPNEQVSRKEAKVIARWILDQADK